MPTRTVLGRSITLHDQNYTVIGVMPRQVTSPQDTDVWLSLMRRSNNPAWMDRSHHPMIFVWGKLKPGVTVDQARTEMKGIAARLEKTYPDTNGKVYAVVTPLLENLVGKYKTNLGLLLGAVVLVLLIACANIANLFAARGAARAREFAIHAAVGATRVQIVRKLLVEGFVIALLGGAFGLFAGALDARRVRRARPARRRSFSTSFVRSAGTPVHVSNRIADDSDLRTMAGLANVARRYSARTQGRFCRHRRSAIRATCAGLVCH